jgi:hypothetical protein
MGNTLPRLSLQLIAPLFQLPGDGLVSANLLDAPRLNVRSVSS